MDTYKKLLAVRKPKRKNKLPLRSENFSPFALQLKQQREQSQQSPPSPATKAMVAEVRMALGPPQISSSEVVRGRVLGKGTFGSVYEGMCREQPVAVKVLHKQNFDERTLATFTQEVEILSQVFHPRVALFMGACFEPGSCMIVTELEQGGDLEKLLRDERV